MFAGHYSTALAARRIGPPVPLWHLFIAVQLVDFVWAIFIMTGVEYVSIEPGFMQASMLNLYHMPYTHSLLAGVLWSVGAGLAYGFVRSGEKRWQAAGIIALAVASHWVLDLIVHAPDLEVYPGGPKIGLGLWQSLLWSQLLEIGLVLVGLALYLSATKPKSAAGKWSPFALVGLMLLMQLINHLPVETPPTSFILGVTALFAYSVLTLLAYFADRTRQSV